jgi:hypothetical protein
MHTDKLKYKELKTVCCLEPVHEALLLNSLKAATIEPGLLMNVPKFQRLIDNKQQKQSV